MTTPHSHNRLAEEHAEAEAATELDRELGETASLPPDRQRDAAERLATEENPQPHSRSPEERT